MSLPPLPEPRRHGGTYESSPFDYYTAEQMREYARAAVAAEREACARLCDVIEDCEDYGGSTPGAQASARCAAVIRARGDA